MKKNEYIDEIFKILKKELKQYKTPSISHLKKHEIIKSPFTTLISCILSLRTKDEVTNKASINLLNKYDTPEKIIGLSEEQIQKLIYPVGFYKTKSKRIIEISKKLIEEYNGQVPNDFNELLKFKGVGKKTAAIVIVYGHNSADFIPVDVHVHVIANRLGWVKSKNPDDTMEQLMKVIPKEYWYDINNLFVQFGQNICVTVSPFCSRCPIKKYCKKISVIKSR